MKIKHLIIISLILAVLAMGAVSASQDVNDVNMTADSDMEDLSEAPLKEDELTSDMEKDNFHIDYEESMAVNCDDPVLKIYSSDDNWGDLLVHVGESQDPVYQGVLGESAEFRLSDLGINDVGSYRIWVNFMPNEGSVMNLIDYMLNVTPEEGHPGLDVDIVEKIYITPTDINDVTTFVGILSLNETLSGRILIYLDGDLYYNSTFASKQAVHFEDLMKRPAFAKHFVQVYFDDGERTTLVKSRVVTMDYLLLLSRGGAMPLGEHKEMFIALPEGADGDLYLTFNGKTTKLEYKNSRAYHVLSSDGLQLGETYEVSVELRGDSYYPNQTASTRMTVVPFISYPYIMMSVNESTMVSIDMPESYSGTFSLYRAKLNEGVFEKDGDAISSLNLSNGKASIQISGLSEGVHDFLIEYANGNYTYEKDFSLSVKANDDDISVSVTPNTLTSGQNTVVKVTAPKNLAKPVDIYVDGEMYATVSLLNKGQASMSIPLSAVGQHYIKVVTDEFEDYQEGPNLFYSNTFIVNVNKASTAPAKKADVIKLTLKKVSVKKSAKKLVLQATLKINGKAVKGKVIKFKFKGKTYKAKTNIKGVAKYTIGKKVLKKLKKGKKVTYQATYGKVTKKYTVKVKK